MKYDQIYLEYSRYKAKFVRFEVLTAVKTTMLFFWFVAPCRLIGTYIRRYLRFRETDLCRSFSVVRIVNYRKLLL
jgi:hypothetical protein